MPDASSSVAKRAFAVAADSRSRRSRMIDLYSVPVLRRLGRLLPRRIRTLIKEFLPTPNAELLMDVVGACNLRCPSCPVGSMGTVNRTGLVDKSLFAKLMRHAARVHRVHRVSLYNWGEPLLHPELPELVRIVKDNGLFCALSSNLNLLRDPETLLRANPDEFRISLSGFTQEIYGQGHARGRIELVKANMRRLAAARRATGAKTDVHVYFHKYAYNLEELKPMRDFATELGFGWMDHWAFLMPIEKNLDLMEGRLSRAEVDFVERQFALPIKKAIQLAATVKHEPCRLLAEQVVLDLQGNALLCCGVFRYDKNMVGRFLEMSPRDLRRAKANHPTCAACTRYGLHRMGEYHGHPLLGPAYDRLVQENLESRQRQGGSPFPHEPSQASSVGKDGK